MTLNVLSLPIDIPWKRRCVSRDMLDPEICRGNRPYRWRSSIAIFEYEPGEEDQTYEGMILTYLKVTCTITGYQENPEEIGINLKGLRSQWRDAKGIPNYIDILQKYYPCYGAVLEVAVGPVSEGETPLEDYPYFLNFEPKKRELYELVSTTGETMSRSLSGVELGKSNTSTTSHEVVDIDKGWSASLEVKAGPIGVGGSASRQGEWGTRDIAQEQSQNLRNSNTSQEARETQSHTTQLTQMYHQLDSYHLGTNRAVFFLHPRPHTLETEHTFVNGPRNIEGIQEFILVVARPRRVEHLAVSAYLETGHIGKVPRYTSELVPGSEKNVPWNDQFHAQPKGDDDETTVYDDKDRIWSVDANYPGFKIQSATLTTGPAKIRYNYDKPNLIDVHPHISALNEDFITVSGKVHSGFHNHVVGADRWEEITYPFRVDIVLVKKEVVQRSDDTLFLTARRLCCPEPRVQRGIRDGIVYERAFEPGFREEIVPGERMPIGLANRYATSIRAAVVRSRNDSEHRLAQAVTLPHTDFAVRSAVRELLGSHEVRLAERVLSGRLREKLAGLGPKVTDFDLLSMPAAMLVDVLDLSTEEVHELRGSLLGFVNTDYDRRKAWLSDRQIKSLFATKGDEPPAEQRGRRRTQT